MRLSAWMMLPLLAGCVGGEVTAPTPEGTASLVSRFCGRTDLPGITYLEEWDPQAALWPEGITRGVTLVYQSPDSPDRFRAYLIDIVSYRVVLQMDGAIADVTYFQGLDQAAAVSLKDDFTHIIVTQIGGLPPKPKPRGNELVAAGPLIDQAVRLFGVVAAPAVCSE